MKGPEVSPGDRCQDLHQESGCGWLRSGEARNWLGLDHGRTPRSLRKRTGSGTHCWTAVARGLRVKQLTSGGDGHGSAQRAAGQRQGGTEGPVAEGVEVAVTGRPQLWATSSTLRGSYSLRQGWHLRLKNLPGALRGIRQWAPPQWYQVSARGRLLGPCTPRLQGSLPAALASPLISHPQQVRGLS